MCILNLWYPSILKQRCFRNSEKSFCPTPNDHRNKVPNNVF